MDSMTDCVVIGAGFAGLTAGYYLQRAGKSVVVLEARDRIGGRTTTTKLAEGGTIDLGGQWIGPGQERVYRLARELQVPIFPTYDQGKHMFEDGGVIKEFAGAVPALDEESMLDLNRAMSELDALAKKINITESGMVRAKRAIVALSPALAARIQYRPALSAERDQLTQSVPMGSVIKCMAVYSEPFWRSAGYSGQSFSTASTVISTCDNTPQSGTPGILVGFVVGSHAEALRRCSDNERRQVVLEEFKKWFGPRATLPLRYVDLSWADEVWSRGGFFGNFAPGVLSAFGEALRIPQGRIHWAGAETAREWIGFIEGAIESGERAATEVISACESFIKNEKQ